LLLRLRCYVLRYVYVRCYLHVYVVVRCTLTLLHILLVVVRVTFVVGVLILRYTRLRLFTRCYVCCCTFVPVYVCVYVYVVPVYVVCYVCSVYVVHRLRYVVVGLRFYFTRYVVTVTRLRLRLRLVTRCLRYVTLLRYVVVTFGYVGWVVVTFCCYVVVPVYFTVTLYGCCCCCFALRLIYLRLPHVYVTRLLILRYVVTLILLLPFTLLLCCLRLHV